MKPTPKSLVPPAKPAYGTVPKASTVPHPARNLGAHLKPSASGEIVTNHHRGAKS